MDVWRKENSQSERRTKKSYYAAQWQDMKRTKRKEFLFRLYLEAAFEEFNGGFWGCRQVLIRAAGL